MSHSVSMMKKLHFDENTLRVATEINGFNFLANT